MKKTEAVLNDVLPASQSAATSAALTPQRTSNNSDVDKAVKEALSHHENRCSLVISGIEDSKSQAHDACFVTDLFSYLGEKDIAVIDCFRLVRLPFASSGSASKPRLLKVLFANSNHRSTILKRAKLLKDTDNFKHIFVRPRYTLAERKRIK